MHTPIVEILPLELKFLFEVKKQSSCAVHLANVTTDQCVAFKVKTTSPKKYCVKPNVGIIKPRSTCDFTVTMQALKSVPAEMQCKDKFLIQSTVVPFGTTEDDIMPDMFIKDGQKYIEEVKLRVILSSVPGSPAKPLADGVLNRESSFGPSSLKEVNSPALLPVNGSTKQEPSSEIVITKDKSQNGVENFSSDDMVTEKLEPIKRVENVEEIRPVMVMDNMKAVRPKDEEFDPVKQEVKPVKDVDKANLNLIDVDETKLKLMKDFDELRSKISTMDAELVKSKYMIEKLKQEKSSSVRESETLKQELAVLRTRTRVVRKLRVGFPPLFVCMVALISLVIGLFIRS